MLAAGEAEAASFGVAYNIKAKSKANLKLIEKRCLSYHCLIHVRISDEAQLVALSRQPLGR
ncbi:hypothetical protein [Mesorhizobium sp.]|uniref:hypothetical protein n=1 Tax=Mesorhizobium sp. TaxID=1871066 RepID=UPI0011FA06AE|nr:hypothetical protein [Mesorhizobium sp.]TIO04676.1 MAG: hypothetical protein E5X88_30710 [Mesorhizobium sp.]TIO29404.1 MAG: hypothetical protein E5X89_31140 [Mesorhizobium sp.]TIP09232.1 MAG: hypothetical protein E5X73_28465 [Mesorhizobium sp.]